MEYMVLINSDETVPTPEFGEAGFEEFMGTWMAYNQKLIDGGHWVSAASLQPTTTATTVRRTAGGSTTTTCCMRRAASCCCEASIPTGRATPFAEPAVWPRTRLSSDTSTGELHRLLRSKMILSNSFAQPVDFV